jgi:putative photosynthetic complex assembly protein
MTAQTRPALRHADREMIPTVLVRAMFALALASLAIVTFAVVTDRPTVARPKPAAVVAERAIVLEGGNAQSVTVREPDGTVVLALEHGGFITVVQNGLNRTRTLHGIDPLRPVHLTSYANGRLAIHDPETGWSVELGSFGDANRAAFDRLMPLP